MKNAGSFCLAKNTTSHNKNLVFKPLFVNKSVLFSSYFSCFKNENKKEKERVFYKRKTWSCGEIIAKNEGNWLRMIKIKARSAIYKAHSSFFNTLRYAKGTYYTILLFKNLQADL